MAQTLLLLLLLTAVVISSVFPCFDEQALKASFQLTLEVPTSYEETEMASNTPLLRCSLLTKEAGLQSCVFEKTPRASTYQVHKHTSPTAVNSLSTPSSWC